MSLHLAPESLRLVQIGALGQPSESCVVSNRERRTGVLWPVNSGAVLSKEPYADALCRFISFLRDNDGCSETE